MKLLSVQNGSVRQLSLLQEDGKCSLLDPNDGWPPDLVDLISSEALMGRLADLPNENAVELSEVTISAPITDMEKVICIGTNYADHAREMGGEPPEIPVVFNKFPSTIAAHDSNVCLPAISQKVDFEAELVVVIGKRGKHIAQQDAFDHVFGYCCGNDISARDWQKGKPGGQWLLGKTFDTFAPIGPCIVTKDEIPDPHALGIRLRLNGETMQDSSTSQLIFSIDYLIAHISKFVTLKPGDLIFTGTPPGVGAGREPQLFLKPGDQLEVEIDGLGVLRNTVVAE